MGVVKESVGWDAMVGSRLQCIHKESWHGRNTRAMGPATAAAPKLPAPMPADPGRPHPSGDSWGYKGGHLPAGLLATNPSMSVAIAGIAP